jgi:hypothetical protein
MDTWLFIAGAICSHPNPLAKPCQEKYGWTADPEAAAALRFNMSSSLAASQTTLLFRLKAGQLYQGEH